MRFNEGEGVHRRVVVYGVRAQCYGGGERLNQRVHLRKSRKFWVRFVNLKFVSAREVVPRYTANE